MRKKSLKIFLSGLGAALSFGYPRGGKAPFVSGQKAFAGDWKNVASDLSIAMKKYKSQKGGKIDVKTQG